MNREQVAAHITNLKPGWEKDLHCDITVKLQQVASPRIISHEFYAEKNILIAQKRYQ